MMSVRHEANMEIIRRHYNALCKRKKGEGGDVEVTKTELLMNQAGLSPDDRPVIKAALDKARETGAPAVAIELSDGRIVTGKTSSLLGSSSAALLNAVKEYAGIPEDIDLISPTVIQPVQDLKVNHLGNHNPRLHTDEVLVALSICAATNPMAATAMKQLEKLKNCEVHSSVILNQVDSSTFKKLGMNLTCEPQYQTKKLFHK